MNPRRIAEALRILADAIDDEEPAPVTPRRRASPPPPPPADDATRATAKRIIRSRRLVGSAR